MFGHLICAERSVYVDGRSVAHASRVNGRRALVSLGQNPVAHDLAGTSDGPCPAYPMLTAR
jgi:chorismate-pyruvate lyase